MQRISLFYHIHIFFIFQKSQSLDFDSVPQSMYVFEGTDYSNEPSAADKKAFDDLVSGMYSGGGGVGNGEAEDQI